MCSREMFKRKIRNSAKNEENVEKKRVPKSPKAFRREGLFQSCDMISYSFDVFIT